MSAEDEYNYDGGLKSTCVYLCRSQSMRFCTERYILWTISAQMGSVVSHILHENR